MTEKMYVCLCVCKRPFTTTCPSLTECPQCAAGRLLACRVADVETATERLLFARLRFETNGNDEAHGNDDTDDDDTNHSEAEFSETGAEPLPEEDDAAVTALLTGQLLPRRPNGPWLEWAIFVMICAVVWLLWLTGGF